MTEQFDLLMDTVLRTLVKILFLSSDYDDSSLGASSIIVLFVHSTRMLNSLVKTYPKNSHKSNSEATNIPGRECKTLILLDTTNFKGENNVLWHSNDRMFSGNYIKEGIPGKTKSLPVASSVTIIT